jgi:hypothetical protein
MINVDKYFFSGKYQDLVLEEYYRMIAWLTDNIAPPLQEYDYAYNKTALGRCGEGWELRLHYIGGRTLMPINEQRRPVQWCVFIDDDQYAVMFKLIWP